MKKSLHSAEYGIVLETLTDLRRKAGLTQRALAERLGREHSFVWRIESGERRLDVVEFAWVCEALDCDPAVQYAAMQAQWRLSLPNAKTPALRAADRSAVIYPQRRSRKKAPHSEP